jgi:hypothetical protein
MTELFPKRKELERTEGIEPYSATLGRRATRPACLPARLPLGWSTARYPPEPLNDQEDRFRLSLVRCSQRHEGATIKDYKTRIYSRLGVGLNLVAALTLAACATPATRTETVEVKVPVAVQPITPAQVPTPPAPLGPRPSSLSAAADALFAQVCKLEAYVLRADPLLRVSAGQKPAELPKYPECEGR